MALTKLEPYMVDTTETFTFANTTIGNITATKQISDAIRNMSADRSIYNSHVHSDPQGGQTGTPSASQ